MKIAFLLFITLREALIMRSKRDANNCVSWRFAFEFLDKDYTDITNAHDQDCRFYETKKRIISDISQIGPFSMVLCYPPKLQSDYQENCDVWKRIKRITAYVKRSFIYIHNIYTCILYIDPSINHDKIYFYM